MIITFIRVFSKKVYFTDLVIKSYKMELLIQVNIREVILKEKEKFLLLMVNGFREIGLLEKWMERDNNILLPANLIKVILLIVLNTAMEYGVRKSKTMIIILVDIFLIKKVALELLPMLMEIFIKVNGEKATSNIFLM